jgi:hypothetical protein
MQWIVLGVLLVLVALSLSACGGGGGEATGTTGEASAEGAVCEGSELATGPTLPEGFPKPGEAKYVEEHDQGPAHIVDGFYEGDIKDAHREYKASFEGEGYTILFDELEDKDSEISYKDPDGTTSGQVALRAECDNGNVWIHITNRPA